MIAAIMFIPSRWMNIEIKIKNTTIIREVYKIRGTIPESENLIS
jgi:hypothetical protein